MYIIDESLEAALSWKGRVMRREPERGVQLL